MFYFIPILKGFLFKKIGIRNADVLKPAKNVGYFSAIQFFYTKYCFNNHV